MYLFYITKQVLMIKIGAYSFNRTDQSRCGQVKLDVSLY